MHLNMCLRSARKVALSHRGLNVILFMLTVSTVGVQKYGNTSRTRSHIPEIAIPTPF
jgi:hypothetical protein